MPRFKAEWHSIIFAMQRKELLKPIKTALSPILKSISFFCSGIQISD